MKTITTIDYQYYADIVCKVFSRLTGFATEIESPYDYRYFCIQELNPRYLPYGFDYKHETQFNNIVFSRTVENAEVQAELSLSFIRLVPEETDKNCEEIDDTTIECRLDLQFSICSNCKLCKTVYDLPFELTPYLHTYFKFDESFEGVVEAIISNFVNEYPILTTSQSRKEIIDNLTEDIPEQLPAIDSDVPF
jgi:hypothetical protein